MKQTTPLSFNHQLTFTPTRKRTGRWLVLVLLLLLMVLAYTLIPHTPEPATVSSATHAPAVIAAVPAEPPGSKVDVVVRRNDTIEGIFRQLKLSTADLNTLLSLPGVGPSFKRLQPGDRITVVHDGAALQAINRRISDTEVLAVTRGENGFAAERVITMN